MNSTLLHCLFEFRNYLIENEKNRKKIGTNARKYVLQYSQKNIMDKWNILFNNCLTLTS